MPILGIFGGLLGHRHTPYKVAIIRDLAGQSSGRWKMRDLQQRIDWLTPESSRRLVRELAETEVLRYDKVRGTYRLTPEARVVAAFCRALTVNQIPHSRIVKVLIAAIRTAQAVGASDEALFQPFLEAIAVLEEDFLEMKALLDDFSQDGLKQAVMVARENVHDMRDLLDHDEDFFGRFHEDRRYLELGDRAHRAVAALGQLADEVWLTVFEQADEIMRRGLTFDGRDIREMAAMMPLAEKAAMTGDEVLTPAQVPPIETDLIFASLAHYLGRPELTAGLPEPTPIVVQPPEARPPNDFRIAASALEDIAGSGGAPLWTWVAAEDWPIAVRRMGASIGAWSRYGPTGNRQLKAELITSQGVEVEEVPAPGVALMSPIRVDTHRRASSP
jgi:DNA-binding HxlR family transcriptional regulator